MEKAEFTKEVYQNEVGDYDLEYATEKHQPYFEFEIKTEKHLIGLDQILECLMLAERIGEIPKLGTSFGVNASERFGINYYDMVVSLIED